jgi:hypothetical protein
LLTLPLTIKSIRNAQKHYDHIPALLASNGATVLIYQLTGILMVAALVALRVIRNLS